MANNPFKGAETRSLRVNPFQRSGAPAPAKSPTAALFKEIRRRREAETEAAAAHALAKRLQEQLRLETDRLAAGKAKGAERARQAAEAGRMRATRDIVAMGRESDSMRTRMQQLQREAREAHAESESVIEQLNTQLAAQAATMERLRDSIRAVVVKKDRELVDAAAVRAKLEERLAAATQAVAEIRAMSGAVQQAGAEKRTTQIAKVRTLRENLRKERAARRILDDALIEAKSTNAALRQKVVQMASAGRTRPKTTTQRPRPSSAASATRRPNSRGGRGRSGESSRSRGGSGSGIGIGASSGGRRGRLRPSAKLDSSDSGSDSDGEGGRQRAKLKALAAEHEARVATLTSELEEQRSSRVVEREASNAARTMVANELHQTTAAHRLALEECASAQQELSALRDRLALRSDHFASMVEENDVSMVAIAQRAER